MKGLELARKYYEEYGIPMLENEFPETRKYLAVGLVGSGSECLGYDDKISQDHDFEPGFCIFLPGEDVVDRKEAFRLERAYAKLPKEFMGFTRSAMSPVGGNRHGVIRMEDFYKEKTGIAGGALSKMDWLHVPSYALREATNGEVFEDNYGEFTRIRESLMDMPEDVRLKRLAGQLLLMAQAGQYNYPRIAQHGEKAAAQLAIFEFVKAMIEVVFLINHEYTPYYKWSFRAMGSLVVLYNLEYQLNILMTSNNEGSNPSEKSALIEQLCGQVIDVLREQGMTKATCGDLEKHAYSVNDSIEDGEIRNLNILYTV